MRLLINCGNINNNNIVYNSWTPRCTTGDKKEQRTLSSNANNSWTTHRNAGGKKEQRTLSNNNSSNTLTIPGRLIVPPETKNEQITLSNNANNSWTTHRNAGAKRAKNYHHDSSSYKQSNNKYDELRHNCTHFFLLSFFMSLSSLSPWPIV